MTWLYAAGYIPLPDPALLLFIIVCLVGAYAVGAVYRRFK